MRHTRQLLSLLAAAMAVVIVAPPPNRAAANQAQEPPPPPPQKPLYEFAYSKYLEEVVRVLESDPKFNEKLRNTPEEDIKSGNIAEHVADLPDPVMEKLHVLKLAELERLREQIAKQVEAEGGAHNVKLPEHLDLQNWEKFNKEDLRQLIKRTVADMEEIDKNRKQDFKEYEMKKQAEEDHKFAQMPPEEREKAKHEQEEQEKRHNEHEKLKHPGSRDQLEEVWEESDQMEKDNFDPKTFFNLHDLNGDGFWNADELEALFQIELEKMYNETNPDDDPREKIEEMYRMREHVVKQMDKNGDRLISMQEFLQDSEAQTPNKDPGWNDLGQQLDHNEVYTEEELKKFEEEYAKQMGWGEDAYRAMEGLPPSGEQPIHPAEVNRGVVPDIAGHGGQAPAPVGGQPPAQPHPPAPQQVQPAAGQQQAPQVPVQHAPIHEEAPKDPTYGI